MLQVKLKIIHLELLDPCIHFSSCMVPQEMNISHIFRYCLVTVIQVVASFPHQNYYEHTCTCHPGYMYKEFLSKLQMESPNYKA